MTSTSGASLGMPLTFGKADVNKETGQVRMQGNVMGINVQETVDELTKAMRVDEEIPQSQIDVCDKKIAALSSLESKVQSLYTSASALRGQREGNLPSGVFSKYMYVVANPVSQNDISLSIGDGLNSEQNFQFRVDQLAQKDSITGTTPIADKNATLGWTGNFTIGTYTLTADGKSAQQISDEINANQQTTGATSQLINAGDGYHFLFTGTTSAVPLALTNNVTGAGTQIPTSSTKTIDDLSAKCNYNGLDIVSTSNTITSVPNLTITLNNVSTTNFNVAVMHDRDATSQAILSFVDSYNGLQDEIQKNMAMNEDGTGRSKDAILFGSRILSSIRLQAGLVVADGVTGISSTSPKTLGSIGISMGQYDTRSGDSTKVPPANLSVDLQALYDSINQNYDGVKKLFAFDASLSDSSFKIVKHPAEWPDELAENNVTIAVSRNSSGVLSATFTRDGVGGGTSYTGTVTEYTVGGASIVGPSGSPYEGLRLIVSDTNLIPNGGTRQTALNATQGIGDELLDVISGITDSKTGDFATELSAINDNKSKLKQQISNIEKRIETRREQLLSSFMKMQEVVNKFLTMQNQLNILLNPGGQG